MIFRNKKQILWAVFLGCAFMVSPLMGQSAYAQQSPFEGLFEKDDGTLKPHETLEAPFATDGQTESSRNKDSLLFLYDKELTGTNDGNILAKAHRTDEQMAAWVMSVVTNLLSFDYSQAQQHINKYQGLFHRPALVEYIKEINASEIVKAMRQGGLASVAIFEDVPEVQNKGNFDGVFRWTFDFPVSVTFRRTSGQGLKRDEVMQTIVTQIKMRIGRVPTKDGFDGALIESWQMEVLKVKEDP